MKEDKVIKSNDKSNYRNCVKCKALTLTGYRITTTWNLSLTVCKECYMKGDN
jgi:hypothetical protein